MYDATAAVEFGMAELLIASCRCNGCNPCPFGVFGSARGCDLHAEVIARLSTLRERSETRSLVDRKSRDQDRIFQYCTLLSNQKPGSQVRAYASRMSFDGALGSSQDIKLEAILVSPSLRPRVSFPRHPCLNQIALMISSSHS